MVPLKITDDGGATDSNPKGVTITEATAREKLTFTGGPPRGKNKHTVPVAPSGAANMHVKLMWNGWDDFRLRIYAPDETFTERDKSSRRNRVEEITLENPGSRRAASGGLLRQQTTFHIVYDSSNCQLLITHPLFFSVDLTS